jgi:hypothetical protein
VCFEGTCPNPSTCSILHVDSPPSSNQKAIVKKDFALETLFHCSTKERTLVEGWPFVCFQHPQFFPANLSCGFTDDIILFASQPFHCNGLKKTPQIKYNNNNDASKGKHKKNGRIDIFSHSQYLFSFSHFRSKKNGKLIIYFLEIKLGN